MDLCCPRCGYKIIDEERWKRFEEYRKNHKPTKLDKMIKEVLEKEKKKWNKK